MRDQGQDFHFSAGDGLRLYCRIFGERSDDVPAVICLPGLTRNSRDFIDLANHLQGRYRVLAPDLRGRGRSAFDPHWENYQPTTYCADFAALLNAQDVRSAVIIGTSLGALLAMLLGVWHPDVIRGIVLNDAGPEVDPVGAARIAAYVGKQPPVRNWADAVAQVRATYGSALPGLSDAEWERYTRQSYSENELGTPVPDSDPNIGELLRSGDATPRNLWPVFEQLAIPILVIRGESSDILAATTVERMMEKANVRQLTVPNRGHAPLLNEPECVAAIDEFLAQITKTA